MEADGYRLLIDCGHSAVAPIWHACPAPDTIDAIYLTHQHADHVLGLLPVLDRWGYDGRRKPLDILTDEVNIRPLQALLTAGAVAYDGRSPFRVAFEPTRLTRQVGPFAVSFAPTTHAVPNSAIRLDHAGRSFAYSGDGRPTPDSAALYRGVDLLLHECFLPTRADGVPFHCDLPTVLELAGVVRVGLYHIKAGQRAAVRAAAQDHPALFVPEAGDTLTV